MDPRVRSNNDGTLYLADWPEPPVAKQKSHGLIYNAIYYTILCVLVLFVLGSLAGTAFFVFFLILAFL